MSNQKSRRERELIYHKLYVPLPFSTPSICSYCGFHASTRDHCPSLSNVISVGTEYLQRHNIPMYLVPACAECNGLLGNKVLWLFVERKDFIAKRLRKRYGKLLRLPAWETDEIEALGRGLKAMVATTQDMRMIAVRRVAFAEAP